MIPHAPHKAPWTSGSNLPLVSTPYPGVMTEEGALALCVFALWSPLLLHRDMAAVDPALTRNTLLQFHGSVIWIKWNSVSLVLFAELHCAVTTGTNIYSPSVTPPNSLCMKSTSQNLSPSWEEDQEWEVRNSFPLTGWVSGSFQPATL